VDYEIPYKDTIAGLSGFGGLDLNQVNHWTRLPAERSIVAGKGFYKAGFTMLGNGDLLASPCYQDNENNKLRIAIFRSRDLGNSWEKLDIDGDDLLGKEPALQTLRSGRVLLITSHPHGFRISRSDDDGVTWKTTPIGSTTETIDYTHIDFAMMRNVLENDDGSLWIYITRGQCYEPDGPPSKGWIYASTDDGETWEESREIPVWDRPEGMFDEGQMLRISDGRMLGIGRVSGDVPIDDGPPPYGPPVPRGDEAGDHMIHSWSSDGGFTWSHPKPLLKYGEVHAHILGLRDGRYLCSYASYHLPFGIFAVVSDDGGETWDQDHPMQLSMSPEFTTGWPTSIELPDGLIITLYATTPYPIKDRQFWVSTTECVRWRLP